ncbi:MAG: TerB family tellurite resistance protein [Paludibacteraceae bacterium]|nr:TerB family tellurite resistance protein [Paludibacteraceae bacterium]
MKKEELFLKSAFCCMACDGEIAPKEVALLKKMTKDEKLFGDIQVANVVNSFVEQINSQGYFFLDVFLNELAEIQLSEEEQLAVIRTAIKTIKADEKVEYSEISFFKQIREKLPISDEKILAAFTDEPEMEDYLLPDIIDRSANLWAVSFSAINFEDIQKQ